MATALAEQKNAVEEASTHLTGLGPSRLRGEAPVYLRYLVAVLCVLVAFGVRYSLTPLLGEELPFMLFIAASLVSAWYGGASAGLVSLLLGLFVADRFFLTSQRVAASHLSEGFFLMRYLFTASLGIVLIEFLHRNRRNLEREVARRARSEAALLQAQAELAQHAQELEARVAERTKSLTTTVGALESLLYHIAHNLRAPLRAMEGYTTLLQEEYSGQLDAKAQNYARHICDASKRMDELIHDLLQYGRLTHLRLEFAPVRLELAIERALTRLNFETKASRAEVKVPAPLPQVVANPELLEEVLMNLFENAIKFVEPGAAPRIEVRAERRGSRVRVWIQDNGPGIDPQYHERIFGAFETLSSRPGESGTGIGLAIVREGMQRMNGAAGVESQLGAGSKFWIELPGV